MIVERTQADDKPHNVMCINFMHMPIIIDLQFMLQLAVIPQNL